MSEKVAGSYGELSEELLKTVENDLMEIGIPERVVERFNIFDDESEMLEAVRFNLNTGGDFLILGYNDTSIEPIIKRVAEEQNNKFIIIQIGSMTDEDFIGKEITFKDKNNRLENHLIHSNWRMQVEKAIDDYSKTGKKTVLHLKGYTHAISGVMSGFASFIKDRQDDAKKAIIFVAEGDLARDGGYIAYTDMQPFASKLVDARGREV